jgi:hypothetical protein
MDPVTMTYYGVICGALAFWSSWLESRWARFGIGIAVGLAAAAILPLARRTIGL